MVSLRQKHERLGLAGRARPFVLGGERLVAEIEVVEDLLAAANGDDAENG